MNGQIEEGVHFEDLRDAAEELHFAEEEVRRSYQPEVLPSVPFVDSEEEVISCPI